MALQFGVNWEEVFWPERKAQLAGLGEKERLALGWDQAVCAASFLGVGPSADIGLVPTYHASDLNGAAADFDNGSGWFKHKRILCAKRKVSTEKRVRRSRKTHAVRSGQGGAMNLADITPEWIRARMKALRLKQADVSEAIGLEQHKLSKSLNGHRQFTTRELEGLSRLLGEATTTAPQTLDPETAELLARIADLPEAHRRIVLALVASLEEAAQEPGRTKEPPSDREG